VPRACNVVADCLASFGACLNVGNSRLWLDQAAESVMPLVSGELPKPVNMELCFHLKKCFLKKKSDHEFIAKAACSFFEKKDQTCQQVCSVSKRVRDRDTGYPHLAETKKNAHIPKKYYTVGSVEQISTSS